MPHMPIAFSTDAQAGRIQTATNGLTIVTPINATRKGTAAEKLAAVWLAPAY